MGMVRHVDEKPDLLLSNSGHPPPQHAHAARTPRPDWWTPTSRVRGVVEFSDRKAGGSCSGSHMHVESTMYLRQHNIVVLWCP